MKKTTERVSTAVPTLLLTLPARPENIAVVRQALAGLSAELGAEPDLVDDIKTASSEAVTNVVTHAYPNGEGPLEVGASVSGRSFEVVIRDAGVGIQPRPLGDKQPSLRVGLPLIGALTDSFGVSGEEGKGTEVRLNFDLHRGADSSTSVRELQGDATSGETRIAVRGSEAGGAAIPKVLEMLVARSNLTLDQLSDVQVLGDFLSHWNSEAAIDARPLELTIEDGDGSLDLRIGPLDPGLGKRMLERGEIPGLGQTLERLAAQAVVSEVKTDAGPAEYLLLEIRAPA